MSTSATGPDAPSHAPRILAVAGEPSGDLHAAHVIEAAQALCPRIQVFGMGGSRMGAAGVELVYDIADSAVMGIAEVLGSVPAFFRKMQHLADLARDCRPDATLLVDFPDFNMRLAKRLARQRIPIVYYIPPKAWAWRPWRGRKVARLADKVISIFPFEAEFYRKAGADVEFVGHPLLDLAQCSLTQREAREALNHPGDAPLVALLPGSRRKELQRLWPILQETAKQIHQQMPETRFLIPLAPSLSLSDIPADPLMTVLQEHIYEILRAADLGIIASGTATLEAACIGTPMIIIYRVSSSTWQIAQRMVHLQHSGLPNIIAGEEIVPELLQDDVTLERIVPIALRLLQDQTARETQQSRLAEVRTQLGEPGAVTRAAQVLLETARRSSG